MVSGAAGLSDGSMIAVFIAGGLVSDVFSFCKGEGMRERDWCGQRVGKGVMGISVLCKWR